ncbi:unnamed protein product [Diabrotica balteata]|uniref:E3 ubiquitin-protein ligase RNF10 n=1 Tax=Diabrotica balteata TaxID=107213 RepID=A0A9N9SVC9_DIABA|nr:unnamed protein product [Diabrotica balteata]
MEKKGNRNLPLAKGSTTDSKKDGISSKPWPRGCRRRESTGSSLSSKPEISRKPQPQRVKTFDKRPRPRGGGLCGTLARNETPSLEDIDNHQQVELGSVFLPGSKKQSLNHLLNFSYTPRDSFHRSERGQGNGNNVNRMMGTKKHKYNKEHFLQANCQFVVNDSGDYKQYLNNPDALVDWSLVEQVNIQVSEFPTCPICLYPPVAAKMTRCGHIYCWSCVLHYLSLSDKPSRKCPICFENIQKQDMKSVVAIPYTSFNIDETITFKLMKRPRGCLIAYPADAETKNENDIFNMSDLGSRDVYSKLLLAKTDDVLTIIEREFSELKEQLKDDFSPERCFIEQAMVLLKERESVVCGHVIKNDHSLEPFGENQLVDALKEVEISGDDQYKQITDEILEDCSSIQPAKFHYFYQASDNQHIYLHAINARMLEHSYGSLEFGPKTITGKILEKEGGSMTEELRKRLRYLQHLPVTCQFEVAEIQLKTPVVNKDTLEHFRDQIEIRRKRRQKRAKEEKRREKRIEVEENRKMGKYPYPNLHLDSNIQFPEFGFETRLRSESESTVPSERSVSPDLAGTPTSVSLEGAYTGPSFAKMLATEKKASPSWPGLKMTSSASKSPDLINVTGSKMKMLSTVRVPSDNEQDPDGYEPVPSFNRSFGDAVAKALEQAEKSEEESIQSSGKKKKKSKQKVLFATNMAYSGK